MVLNPEEAQKGNERLRELLPAMQILRAMQ
jgi:hypothetical protein